ncbi:ATP-binding protein [Agromyces atrinae]|uniref:sensor histidine kinase n=1 Tax=Agromyces atrinae TaxID=592376 RepID=UPI001F592D67|nr:ATP-binding protein [Agromyces atrinae]MCI2957181.1 ATP-binding protein [Agromyces atrinae]
MPFVIGTIFVAGVIAVALPQSLIDPLVIVGFSVIALASVAGWFLPWERWGTDWLIAVPVLDIIGIALMRTELMGLLPGASMLAIFPILWLAYGFRRWAIGIAILGSLFITSFVFAYRGSAPSSLLEWANVVTLPAIIVGVAIVGNIAAAQLRRSRQRLVAALEAESAALRKSQDDALLQRAIFDTVSAGIAFYDADSRLVVANQHGRDIAKIVGFELDQPPYAGDNVLRADRETSIPHDEQAIPRALRGEEIVDHVAWLGPPDQQMAVMVSSTRVHRHDGVLLGTVVVAYDITELAHAIEVRELFLSTVSHELRTPLTGMAGYLELLEDSIDPNDTVSAKYVDVISRTTENLANRIGELLSATTTAAPLSLAPTPVDALLDEVVAASTRAAAERDQALEIVRDGSTGAVALVDAPRMTRALEEVVDNAIKFAPPGSTITITRTVSDGEFAVCVADEGPGISRGERTRVFDKFYRTEHARSNAIQGFGLGLTVAKNVISAHDGRIAIDSAAADAPTGTRVTITLPLRDEGGDRVEAGDLV